VNKQRSEYGIFIHYSKLSVRQRQVQKENTSGLLKILGRSFKVFATDSVLVDESHSRADGP
jgi:hypothetical protein